MPKKQKINLEKVLASLATQCVKCGESIPPGKRRLVDREHVECPKCGGYAPLAVASISPTFPLGV